MKRFWLPMLFFAFSLPAQEGAPEQDPDIVLPPMFLEIEDKTKEDIRVGLPKEDSETEITLPELTVPMPDPAEAVFETERIDEFLTEIGTQNALTPSDSPRTPSAAVPIVIDAYAEGGSVGTVGLGFSLFGTTQTSRFRFSADHLSRDGFGFQPWGGAFFDRRERLSGSYAYRNRIYENETEMSFESRGFGTQNLSVETAVRNDLFFSLSDRFALTIETLRFEAAVGFEAAHRYADDVSVGATDLVLTPRLSLDATLPGTKLKFAAGYGWNGSLFAENNGHTADFLFEFDSELPKAVNIAGGIGLFWDNRQTESVYGADLLGFSIPFYLRIYGSAADFFSYRFQGGFENERQSYAQLSRNFQCLDGVALPTLSGWFAEAELDFRIGQMALISAGLNFDRKSGTLLIEDLQIGENGLIPVSFGVENLLYASMSAEVTPVAGLRLNAGWEGSLLPKNRYYLKPRHRLEGGLEYTIPKKWFTLRTDLLFEHYNVSYIPEWSVAALFAINEHFRLTLALDDLLAPIYENGRPTVWGGYIAPGFGASILLEIKY